MAAYDDWVPIPPYAELKARVAIFEAEHMEVCKWGYWAQEEISNNYKTSFEAIKEGCNKDQVLAVRMQSNALLNAHVEAHEAEKERLKALTGEARQDMWDHVDMAERGRPSSAKRRRHFHAMCDPMSLVYKRKWVYEHLPSDVRAERRARALERWRKAAYLLSVLAFWKHATNKDGSKAARAALERVSKRARVD